MTKQRFLSKENALRNGALASVAVALAFLGLSLLYPTSPSRRYDRKSINSLRSQAEAVRNEFAAMIAHVRRRQKTIQASAFPKRYEDIFLLFRRIGLNSDIEGIAYYSSPGRLTLWTGRVVDVRLPPDESTAVVRDKASYYLVLPFKIRNNERAVLFRLLAFIPQFRTSFSYVRDYYFLSSKLKKNCAIEFLDYREDSSGFEKIFSRHQDEWVGQPTSPKNEIQTFYFPLRNEKNSIVATANLSSPPLESSVLARKERCLLVFFWLLGLALILFIIERIMASLPPDRRSAGRGISLILALAGLRAVLIPVSRMGNFQALPVFSPAKAALLFLGPLSQSPSDMFLTALLFFLAATVISLFILPNAAKPAGHRLKISVVLLQITLFIPAPLFLSLIQDASSRITANSNVNLLFFSMDAPFILLHAVLFLLLAGGVLLSYQAMKSAAAMSSGKTFPAVIGAAVFAGFQLGRILMTGKAAVADVAFQTIFFAVLLLFAIQPHFFRQKEALAVFFLIGTFFLYSSLHDNGQRRSRLLVENFLKNKIVSQQNWGDFLMRQTLAELDLKNGELASHFKNAKSPNIAQDLWAGTTLAKFSWHSCLELLGPDGKILSRFSLNIPLLQRPAVDSEASPGWSLNRVTVPFLGKDKDLLLGYKDWFDGAVRLGRTLIYLAIDPETLPFLYSANPYYELLRVSALPSLNQLDLGFAMFDLHGKLLFNPNKISSGLPSNLLYSLTSDGDAVWTVFKDRNRTYDAYAFRLNRRIYLLFLPRKTIIPLTVEFFKLLFLEAIFLSLLILLPGMAIRGRGRKGFFWSFSNRVYVSFIAVTLLSLLLFSVFTQTFFNSVFSRRYIEETELHAVFARNVMEDFIFLEREENPGLTAPPEDLVLWISSAISNDVNLYRDGKLMSSSRGEFFDSGLLPQLIDGEIYYRLIYENKPFSTGRQRIGSYSFQTLTIPYPFLDSQLLISLPFPFEQQEIARAVRDLVEFLILASAFFIAFTLVFAQWIGRMIITPVRKLLLGTREVELGNLDVDIEHTSQDEMKTLIDGFNAMVRSLKRHQQDLAEMSRKVAWAEIAQKVAHEIKNPLTPIQLSAEHLLRVYEDRRGDFEQALKESASYIISEVENLRKIAQEFLEISRDASLRREVFDLRALVRETLSPYQKMISERIAFEEHYQGDDFSIEADKSKIRIAVRNIVINAIESIHKQGRIVIGLREEGGELVLEIEDTGSGMSQEVMDRIFEPHFSTKDIGTGLGLPIARKIIEDHGGSIQVWSEWKKGTRIAIRLPRWAEPAGAPPIP